MKKLMMMMKMIIIIIIIIMNKSRNVGFSRVPELDFRANLTSAMKQRPEE